MRHLLLFSAVLLLTAQSIFGQNCCAGFEANFSYNPMFTVNGIEFQNLSGGNWSTIAWNFGDNHTSNDQNPSHVYSEPGIYQVCVVIENNDGCRSELCYEVAVETQDICNDFLADYIWSVNPSNSLGVQFDNISPQESDFYIWHFGDGSNSNDVEPYHEYAEGGMYQVCLVLETNGGCRSEYCREVCVEAPSPEPPTAANCCEGFEAGFNYFPTQTENRIEFQNMSTGDWDAIHWNYGDGTTSTQNSPDHIFPHAGIYQVCVVIESNDGCRSELCYEVAVETTPDPCNDFLADYTWHENVDSLGIQFENLSQANSGVYIWHFGDGQTSHDASPYHEYAHPGVYQVCLVVENNDGCRSEYCRSVCVEDFNPCAGFETSFHWSVGSNSHIIEFDGIYAGQIDAIIWHFGDGTTSSDENPHHEYAEPGLYEVCLVIENNDGCRSEYCHMVSVDQSSNACENFEANFTWVADYEHAGIHFENLSTGNPTSYTWHFGDGAISHDAELIHHYEHTGAYQVCLHIENGDGCSAEFCQMVFLPSYFFYVAAPVGIDELVSESTVTVFPNPFEDVVRFATPVTGNIDVLDVQGRVFYTCNAVAISSVNLNGLKTGIYLFRVSDANGFSVTRILKK